MGKTIGNSFGSTFKTYGSGKQIFVKGIKKYPIGASVDITNIADGTLIPAGSLVKLDIPNSKATLVKVKAATDIAAYSSSKASYAVGDIVKNDSKIYKCKTAISAAEAFAAAKWTEITIDDVNSSDADIAAVNGITVHDVIVNKTDVTNSYCTVDVAYAGMIFSSRLDYVIPSKVLENLPQIVEFKEA